MKIERTRIFSTTFSLPLPSSDLKVPNGGEKGKTLQYLSESSDKENEMRIYMKEKYVLETGRTLLTQFLALYSFYTYVVVKPLGMNVIIFPLIFIPKSRPCVLHTNLNNNSTPVITIIGVPFTVLTFGVFRKFKQGRF